MSHDDDNRAPPPSLLAELRKRGATIPPTAEDFLRAFVADLINRASDASRELVADLQLHVTHLERVVSDLRDREAKLESWVADREWRVKVLEERIERLEARMIA